SDTVPDACRTDCQLAHCGDGVTDAGEECDDGNTTAGDGCDSNCALTCGSGTGASRNAIDQSTGHCYAVYDDVVLFYHDAIAFCDGIGAHLPAITSSAENAIVLSAVGAGNDPWLGADDIPVEGSFTWGTGFDSFASFQNFAAAQLDNDIAIDGQKN